MIFFIFSKNKDFKKIDGYEKIDINPPWKIFLGNAY
jgi:hypothetical protein